jgi:hypothetical protein
MSQEIAVPVQYRFDIQLGPDGHPWIRMNIGTPVITVTTVFPYENAEDVIFHITEGIRGCAKQAIAKKVDTVLPDFTGIKLVSK